MTDKHSLVEALHGAGHRIPGVPAHAERAAGHHGNARHGRPAHAARQPSGATRNHAPGRPPRVLVAWQRRIAAFFGQEL